MKIAFLWLSMAAQLLGLLWLGLAFFEGDEHYTKHIAGVAWICLGELLAVRYRAMKENR